MRYDEPERCPECGCEWPCTSEEQGYEEAIDDEVQP
jgi:hypothetical protein